MLAFTGFLWYTLVSMYKQMCEMAAMRRVMSVRPKACSSAASASRFLVVTGEAPSGEVALCAYVDESRNGDSEAFFDESTGLGEIKHS